MSNHQFSYRTSKNGKVFISWRSREVMVLDGRRAELFLQRLAGLGEAEQQPALARITGNFWRG